MDTRTEIDATTYQFIYEMEVAFGIKRGMWLDAARQRAAEIMDGTFVARPLIQRTCEHDIGEYEEEMSLGGRPYRVE
jgi:hypothetical protein